MHLPWDGVAGTSWDLADHLSGQRFARDGDELADGGLYVGLDPWGFHFLAFTAAAPS